MKTCRECGKEIAAGSHGNRVYCSRSCKAAVDLRRINGYYTPRNNRYERICTGCGVTYFAKRKHGQCCSELCTHRANMARPEFRRKALDRNQARRAVIRGASKSVTFSPFDIFDRDGWKCRICGIDTPKELRAKSSPNAPELDHIFPLSKGGAHTPENTQCLCRRCNRTKSASVVEAA